VVDGRVDSQPAAEPADVGASCWGPEQQPGKVVAGSLPDAVDAVGMLAGVVE
jgi:hypothetical protein